MTDGSHTAPDLGAIASHLLTQPRHDGLGQIVVMTAAVSNSGVSYAARDLALRVAAQGQSVFLADMDVTQNAHAGYFFDPNIQAHYGAVQGPYRADFEQPPFWQVSPSVVGQQVTPMTIYGAGQSGVAFTHFNWDMMAQGQTVGMVEAADYWTAVRQTYGLTIVDAPALDRSPAAQTLAQEADGIILVTGSAQQTSPQVMNAYHALNTDGRCWGLVLNDGVLAVQNPLSA